MKSGNLNFLKPSGPLQACNGTALTLTLATCFGSDEPSSGLCEVLNKYTGQWILKLEFLIKKIQLALTSNG
jgi:hypothetical protein